MGGGSAVRSVAEPAVMDAALVLAAREVVVAALL